LGRPQDPRPGRSRCSPRNEDRPYAIVRGGQSYLRSGNTLSGQDVQFNNLPQRTLTALQRGLAGFRWESIQGERIDYDAQGRMIGYQNRQGNRISLERDTEGRIVAAKDHHGDILITLSYSGSQLASVKDPSGREVNYEYSGERLVAMTDVLGQRWQYHYDANGLAGYTDPLGQRNSYILGKKDSLQEVRLPDGRWTKYSYGYEQNTEQFYMREVDQSGLVKESWYDRLGHQVRRTENGETLFTRQYVLSDGSTDVSKIADAYRLTGKSLALARDASLRQERSASPYVAQMIEQDAHGNRTTTEYNRFNQVVRIQYADGSETRKSYDPASNQVSEELDELGNKIQYRYDSQGNLTQRVKAAGTPEALVITFRYNADNQLVEEVRAGNGDTPEARRRYEYDGKGNRSKAIDPLGHATTYIHDAQGNVLSLTNALGHTWTSSYDAAGNLLSLTTPLHQTISHRYDALGRQIKTIGANGVELSTEYNAANLPVSITVAANARTEFEYDANQRLTAIVDPLGNQRQQQYDARGQLVAQLDAAGNRIQYQYDKDRLAGIDYPTYRERYAYDSRTRWQSETREYQEDGVSKSQSDQYRYLRNGLLEQWLDAANNPSGSEYDAQGRLIASRDAEGGITRYGYDLRSNLTQVTDPTGRITQFLYDARDAVIAEIKPGDASTPRSERRYRYDAVGNLIETVTPDGRVSRYAYDAGNRLIEERHFANQGLDASAERTTFYAYSVLDNLQRYEDQDSAAVYEHDALGRVISTTVTYKTASPAFSKTYRYSYDANGRKTSYTTPEQQTYAYRYTADGQLAGVSIPGEGSLSQQNFNWRGPQQILFPGGSSLQLVHDGLLRYSSRTLNDPAGNPILSHAYQYDAVGNIAAIEGEEGATQYGYDKLYRLTQAQYPQGDARTNEAYAYDGVGNRLAEAASQEALDIGQWQYNAHNQLVSHDGIGYRYNADGHLIEKGALQAAQTLKQADGIDHWQYRYDSRERLVEVSKNGQLLASYAYNPLGQRISKTLVQENRTTYYLYSEEGLVGEYDEQGNLQQEFAWDPTAYWMSRPLFTRAQRHDNGQWTVSYYGNSHLGTPEVAFEKSGEVTWRARAQAFGETQVSLNTIDNPLRFPGQYFDEESGLHYNYFRDYDPGLGRYVEGDPIGLEGGINRYLYAVGRVLGLIDPLGLYAEVIVWQPVGHKWSSFGHVSSNVNGVNYSWGPGGWDTKYPKASDYAEKQKDFRSGVGVILKLTPEQEKILVECYKEHGGEYSAFSNNCGDPHLSCLKKALKKDISDSFYPVSIGNDLLGSDLYGGSTFYDGPKRKFWDDGFWAR